MTDRFIIEHGVVHDIKTGRHLTQAIEDDYPQQLCDLLNEQERTIDGYREALLVLVELKRFKRQIEAGTANADMKRYYEANKEGAWLAAEAMLVGCVRTEELRREGHSALRVKNGKLEVFDPHPPRDVKAAAKAWIQQVQVLPVLPPNAEEGFYAGAAWALSPQAYTEPK